MRDHLTLFCCPKPFQDHIGIIQRNAIISWLRLSSPPQVILLGRDEGIADLAHELYIPHIPSLACTPQGTPRVDALFAAAQAYARTPWLGYINADILLMDDFSDAFQLFLREMDRSRQTRALLTSQRVDIFLHDLIDFTNTAWQTDLRELVERTGARMPKIAIDLFVFNHGLYQDLPPLALGRTCWDNYLMWEARERGAAIVDASDTFMLVHQCHGYAHAGGSENAWKGQEAAQNQSLTQGRMLTILDATHMLDKRGLRRGKPKADFDQEAFVIQKIRAGLAELERGNVQSAKDLLENLVTYIQGLRHARDQRERGRVVNRVRRLTRKVEKLVGH